MVTKPDKFLNLVNGQSTDDPSQKHLLYLTHSAQIQLVNDIYHGIDTAKDYIFQFPQELDDTFDTRKDRATLRNFVKRAVEAFVGMIFRKPLEIDNYGPRTTKLFQTIDTRNSIQTFTKNLTTAVTKDGGAYILADAPSVDSDGKPYLLMIDRLSLINWRKDKFGNFTMAVIEEWVEEPNGKFGTQYIKQWRCYDENANIELWRNNSDQIIGSGKYLYDTIETGFDEIPLVEILIDNVPILYDTAKMNVKHLNRQSHKDRYLTMAALPIPVIWGADVNDDGTTSTAKPALVIGVDEAFMFTGTKDESDFQWRELSGTSIQALEDDLNSITEDITTGILRAAETASTVQKTATEVQLLQAEASNRVTTIATAVQIGMIEALEILSDINKESVPSEAVFQINKDFNASLMGSDGARVVLESYLLGLVSTETFLQTLADMELIDIGSAADEIARIKEDEFTPVPKTQTLLGSTDNRLKGAAKGEGGPTQEKKVGNKLKDNVVV